MKRYSTSYPLIFGMIFFVIGIFIGQITITLLLGIVPIMISIILKWDEYDEKKQGKETSTDRANRIYEESMSSAKNKAQPQKSCCPRCGIDLSLLPVEKVKKIDNENYCDVCEQILLRPVNNIVSTNVAPRQTPPKVETQPSPQKVEPKQTQKNTVHHVKCESVCARCRKPISEDQIVWIGNHRFCKNCANTHADAKKFVSSVSIQKQRSAQDQSEVNVLEHPPKNENVESTVCICSVCKRTFSDNNWIFIDGKYYCEDCYNSSYDETCDKNTVSTDALYQNSYEISGIINHSIHARVVDIADRLLAGGFAFHKAGGANEISNNDVITYEKLDMDYNDFKHGDVGKDYSCICAFLARNTLKVYILSESERVVLRWIDISDKAFATTKLFAEKVIEEVYENTCILKQIDNMELNSAFLSNWNQNTKGMI